MVKVAAVRCESYDYPEVKAAVKKGIDLLGGASAFAKPGELILLKPNWIVAAPPEKCATTHPMIFKAVGEVLQSTGAKLAYGDSPAHHTPEIAAQKTGFAEPASQLGMSLADFRNGKEIKCNQAIQNKKLTIANGVLECDGLISLSKLKTHGFLKLSGAVKNQLGCIPGLRKGEFHVKLPNPADFARMLVDVNFFVKPRLFIMDGIIGMEGNGPMGGDPKKLNVLLFSTDPVALDATVCRIINVDPELSHTITIGQEAGLGTYREDEIERVGDPIDGFTATDFNVNRGPIRPFKGGGGVLRFINNILVPKPWIMETKCVKCGICIKMCPVKPKVVDWHDGDKNKAPSYQYDRCIRCYCCQEVCPEGAIKLRVPLIRRLFHFKKR